MTGDEEENKCKFEFFVETCHREREPNSEFCICHLEDKDKGAKKFWAEVDKILDDIEAKEFNFAGFFFIPEGEENKIDFRGITFSKPAKFTNATFSEEADFWGATFSKNADFDEATFSKEVSFIGATFSEEAIFMTTTFSEEADFDLATFSKEVSFTEATFSENANFLMTTFSKDAYFTDTTFSKDAIFKQATFKEKARFQESKFKASSSFKGAEFNEVYFRDTCFDNKLDFSRVFIKSYAKFTRTEFHSEVDFTECDFGNPERISFNGVNLGETLFKNTDLSRIRFENCTWANIDRRFISIQNIIYKKGEPIFGLYDELLLRKEENPSADDYSSIETLYRQLKYNYEEKRSYPDAGEFYLGEMEMRRLNPNTRKSTKVILSIYRGLGVYGEAFVLPSLWFVILILFSMSGFYLMSDRSIPLQGYFKTALTFAYLRPDFSLTPSIKSLVLGLLTSVAGVILIALTVICIKRKVRR